MSSSYEYHIPTGALVYKSCYGRAVRTVSILYLSWHTLEWSHITILRSQAVARIADRIAHLGVTWRDVIGHVTIWYPIGHLLVLLWNQASRNGFRDIHRRMYKRNGGHDLDMNSKQKSRSFILVPIDFSYTTSWAANYSRLPLGCTV